MNNLNTDLADAISVLRVTYERLKPNVPWDLIEKVYNTERDLQHEHDRDIPLDRLRKLISVHVELEFSYANK